MNLENNRSYQLLLTYNKFLSNQCESALSYNSPNDDKNIKDLLTKMDHLCGYFIDEIDNLKSIMKNNK